MRSKLLVLCGLVIIVGASRLLAASSPQTQPAPDWPAAWLAGWSDPPAELRPLQIVHGVADSQATPAGMGELKKLGLGGIVCNVDFARYLVDEAGWATLVKAVDSCRQVGLRVWLYDEKGYPSGSAGGLVLKQDPGFEAVALAYDPSLSDPFVLRKAYEHTHASNNFHAARRYPNLIDSQAVRAFIERTHGAYWQRLQKDFGATIEATFTDEPSLMAVNLGQLPEQVRSRVPVEDPLDASVKPLPCVPWVQDLPDRYRERYGEDLLAVRRSLFAGEADADRQVRRRFWGLIADVMADRYFGQIESWCGQHHIASSGHTLWEEMPLHHVPLEGNALKALRRMHIPGLDVLSSDPEAVIHIAWLSALLPESAALAEGRRRVMTEVSDFAQTLAGGGPASLADMQATAGWQAALGVTEFTLYYEAAKRPAADYRSYMDYVGRLNAVLRDARPSPTTLLYYPIYDLWAEYLPVAEPLKVESQSARTRQLINSFLRLGQQLLTAQIPFALADHEVLAGAKVHDGRLWVGNQGFAALVLPAGVELPEAAAQVVRAFESGGGRVVRVGDKEDRVRPEVLAKSFEVDRLRPASDRMVLGRFLRDGREILLLVNVGTRAYAGAVKVDCRGDWWLGDPSNGRMEPASFPAQASISISVPARGAVILVGPEGSGSLATGVATRRAISSGRNSLPATAPPR